MAIFEQPVQRTIDVEILVRQLTDKNKASMRAKVIQTKREHKQSIVTRSKFFLLQSSHFLNHSSAH